MSRRLIINADDFGMSQGINRGILEAHRRGVVTSTSLLVNGPAAAEARELPAGLGLGLHLNLSWGRPLGEVPSLCANGGDFAPAMAWVQAPERFVAAEIRRELHAQVQRFEAIVGRTPDHLDSHQFVACFHPDAFAAMLDLAAELDVPIRSPMDFLDPTSLELLCHRIRRENGAGPRFEDVAELPTRLSAVRRQGRRSRVPWPDAFVHSFYGSAATPDGLEAALEPPVHPERSRGTSDDATGTGVTELMCHPGCGREVEVLTRPGLAQSIARADFALTHFGEVWP